MMTEHNDPPVSNPASKDDDWDDVVFDDTEVPLSGSPAKRKSGKAVKMIAVLALLVAAGAGGYYYLMMQADNTPMTPATMAMQQQQANTAVNTPQPMPEQVAIMPDMNADAMPADPMPSDPSLVDPTEVVEDIDLDTLVAGNNEMDMPEWDENVDSAGMVETVDGGMPPPEEMMAEDIVQNDGTVITSADLEANDGMPPPLEEETTTVAIDTDDLDPDADAVVIADEQVDVTIEPAPAAEVSTATQEEIDRQLEEELIESLTSGTAPTPPVSDVSTEEALINNLETMSKDMTGEPVPDRSRIEADAYIRPQPEKYYIIEQESAPVQMNRELLSAKRALNEGRNALALDMFSKLYEINPNDMRIQMGRAVAMQRLGRYTEALSVYEQILRDNPNNLEALTNMLGILSVQNPAYSVDKLQRLQATYPANAGVMVQLALAYGSMNYTGEAVKLLHSAYNIEPNNPTIAYNLAVMYDRAGDRVNAAMFYRRALVLEREGGYRGAVPVEAIQARLAGMR